jgi:hypothetical protein
MADSKENPQQSIGEQETPAPGSWLEKMERMGQEQAAQRTEPELNQGKILTLEERLEKMRQQREAEGQKNKPSDQDDGDTYPLRHHSRSLEEEREEQRKLALDKLLLEIEAFDRYRHRDARNRGYPEGYEDPRFKPEDRLKRLENMKQEQAAQRTEPELNQEKTLTLEERLEKMRQQREAENKLKEREPERPGGRSRGYDEPELEL